MIRKFNKDDLEQVTQIWLEVNTRTHHFIPETYWTAQLNMVKELLPQAELYVYEKNGKILGFVGLSDHYIAGIFVSSISQSQGIGKELLDYAKSIKAKLSLNVYQKNERAIKFYQREKFIIEAGNRDENTGEQEFLMVWER